MSPNEAAERLRSWMQTDNEPPAAVELLDAALAEERRHVIEQIRERVLVSADRGDHEFGWKDAVQAILDDLSVDSSTRTPEQDR